ncbi:MAG: calcium-binding protein [Xanthobacteraceae bacterium]
MVTRVGDGNANSLLGNDNEDDLLQGLDGNDLLRPLSQGPGGGSDVVDGGNHAQTALSFGDTLEVDVGATFEFQTVNFSLTRITSVSGRYDVIASNIENVTFAGGSGDDVFDVRGAVKATIAGRNGIDRLIVEFASATANLNISLSDTGGGTFGAVTYSSIERLTATTGSGNDVLKGGSNADILIGGMGNDTFLGSSGWDTFDGGAGIDVVNYSVASIPLFVDLANGRLTNDTGNPLGTFFSIEAFVGGSGNDRILGDGFANGLNGGRGNDRLIGRSGDDTLLGGLGHDELYGEAGQDRLDSGPNEDTLVGGSGKDTLLGGDHNDILQGGLHSDVIIGGGGFDRASYTDFNSKVTVNLTTGKATHSGGTDTLRTIEAVYTGNGHDIITGNSVRNILDGGRGNNTIDGKGGNDLIWGDVGRDTLKGSGGNDDIYGMDGRDIITGGLGRDRLFGNYRGDDGDKDYFVYNSVRESPRGSLRDIIEQFGKTDVIDLRNIVSGKLDYRGENGYTASSRAELLVIENGRITGVSADINGDGRSDLEILVDALGLRSSNFLL